MLPQGTLLKFQRNFFPLLTEAGTTKQQSLHLECYFALLYTLYRYIPLYNVRSVCLKASILPPSLLRTFYYRLLPPPLLSVVVPLKAPPPLFPLFPPPHSTCILHPTPHKSKATNISWENSLQSRHSLHSTLPPRQNTRKYNLMYHSF